MTTLKYESATALYRRAVSMLALHYDPRFPTIDANFAFVRNLFAVSDGTLINDVRSTEKTRHGCCCVDGQKPATRASCRSSSAC